MGCQSWNGLLGSYGGGTIYRRACAQDRSVQCGVRLPLRGCRCPAGPRLITPPPGLPVPGSQHPARRLMEDDGCNSWNFTTSLLLSLAACSVHGTLSRFFSQSGKK
eukprot:6214260-Pleurochrysis_carterae.AAC.6